jgi:hypothetical protein
MLYLKIFIATQRIGRIFIGTQLELLRNFICSSNVRYSPKSYTFDG